MKKEKGLSANVASIQNKLDSPVYMNNAIDIISEQLLSFFYAEWNLEEI